jgi:NAD-dependent dihydropyrimidine dehydrogenase PreA subunit
VFEAATGRQLLRHRRAAAKMNGNRVACAAESLRSPDVPEFTPLALALYALPLAGIVAAYLLRRRRREAAHSHALAAAVGAGLTEPVSLHPVVDPVRCIGSSTCVAACPEQALGIIGGKAQLTNPAACIGHGACAASCPV